MPVFIRKAGVDDAQAITTLFQNGTGRLLEPSRLLLRLREYPAFVAEESGDIAGFLLSSHFAFEETAAFSRRAVITFNSALYESREEKRSAASFYAAQGYEVSFRTDKTVVFYKYLPPSPAAANASHKPS